MILYYVIVITKEGDNMNKITIGEMIKQIRKSMNVTQKDFGNLFFMKDSQIRRYESGRVIPNANTLEKILISSNLRYCIEYTQDNDIRFLSNIIINDKTEKNLYYFNRDNNTACVLDPEKDTELINNLKERSGLQFDTDYVKKHTDYYINLERKILISKLNETILDKANVLNDQGKQKAIDYMDDLAQMDKYKK